MKNFAIISILMFLQATSAQTICDSSLRANQPAFQTALNNLYSFSYVRSALHTVINQNPQSAYCVSAVALGNNIYQYFKYYIKVEIQNGAAIKPKTFHFLFQDASVQAFHNVGGQPWAGLNPEAVTQADSQLINQAQFVTIENPHATIDPIEISKTSRKFILEQNQINMQSLSAVPIYLKNSSNQYYLITWLTKSESNPFVSPVITRGVLLQVDAQRNISMAENINPNEDVWMPLENNLLAINQSLSNSQTEWTQKLLNLVEY